MKHHVPCDYCASKAMVGIHCPADFDDREESRDGKVYVAKCDACGLYDSDMDAAEAVARKTGWTICKSYDRDDNIDPEERVELQEYFRPYFNITIMTASREVG